jgi:hypothetical protein
MYNSSISFNLINYEPAFFSSALLLIRSLESWIIFIL